MARSSHRSRLARSLAAGAAALAVAGVAACSDGGIEGIDDETPGVVEYDGSYDEQFAEEVESYEGDTVQLTGDVQQVVSQDAFTIIGENVGELLVVHADAAEGLESGTTVEVTGTLRTSLDLPAVEGYLEEQVDDGAFAAWDEEPYLEAEQVDTP